MQVARLPVQPSGRRSTIDSTPRSLNVAGATSRPMMLRIQMLVAERKPTTANKRLAALRQCAQTERS